MKNDKPLLLVVDDEPDMLSSLIALLRREFELLTAESGEEALEILATHTVHVLMTDQRHAGNDRIGIAEESLPAEPLAGARPLYGLRRHQIGDRRCQYGQALPVRHQTLGTRSISGIVA